MSHLFCIALSILVTGVGAALDARTGRIPNWLTLSALPVALLARFAMRGSDSLAEGMVGLFAAGSVPFLMFALSKGRAIGGGDVKLFAALGALLGAPAVEIELLSFVLVAVFALILATWRGELLILGGSLLRTVGLGRAMANVAVPSVHEMRMGPAIFVATVAVVAANSWSVV